MIYGNNWELQARNAAEPHFVRVAQARRELVNLNRDELEAVAEAAIAMLDDLRDPDEDQCTAGDDGCGRFCGGEWIGVHWGSDSEGEAELALVPQYGDDQRDILGRFGVASHVD